MIKLIDIIIESMPLGKYGSRKKIKYRGQYIKGVENVLSNLSPEGKEFFLKQLKKQKSQYLCQGIEGGCIVGSTSFANDEIERILDNIGKIMTTDPIDVDINWKEIKAKGDVSNNRKALKIWLNIASKVYKEMGDKTFMFELFKDLKIQKDQLMRFAAPVLYKSTNPSSNPKYYSGNKKTSGYTEEHVIPADYIMKSLFQMTVEDRIEEDYDVLMNKYFQVLLNNDDDVKLGKAGLSKSMPSGWDYKTDDPFDRYKAAGIDLNTIEKL